jgi:hypothetical protein
VSARCRGAWGSATVLLAVGVVVMGGAVCAAQRAAVIAIDRARADLVAEAVAASVASERVRGLDADTAIARGHLLAARDGVRVVRLEERGDRIEVRVARHRAVATAAAELSW